MVHGLAGVVRDILGDGVWCAVAPGDVVAEGVVVRVGARDCERVLCVSRAVVRSVHRRGGGCVVGWADGAEGMGGVRQVSVVGDGQGDVIDACLGVAVGGCHACRGGVVIEVPGVSCDGAVDVGAVACVEVQGFVDETVVCAGGEVGVRGMVGGPAGF